MVTLNACSIYIIDGYIIHPIPSLHQKKKKKKTKKGKEKNKGGEGEEEKGV